MEQLGTVFYNGIGALNKAKEMNDKHKFIVRWERPDGNIYGAYKNPTAFFRKWKKLPAKDRTFHQIIHDDFPGDVSYPIYADLDCSLPDITVEEIVDNFETFMEYIFCVKMKMAAPKWKYTNASAEGKKSLHAISHDYIFLTKENQKEFWGFVEKIQGEIGTLLFLEKSDRYRQKSIIDYGVYGTNKSYRLPGNIKLADVGNEARRLEPWSLINDFARFDDADDYIEELLEHVIWATGEYGETIPIDASLFPAEYSFSRAPDINSSEHDEIFNVENIEAIIMNNVPNVSIAEERGNLIILRNEGVRKCIINGEDNHSDGGYCVIKSDGLYFGCHDENCKKQLKLIHKFDIESDFDEMWREFQKASLMTEAEIKFCEEKKTAPESYLKRKWASDSAIIKALNKNYTITTALAKSIIIQTIRRNGTTRIGLLTPQAVVKNLKNKGRYEYSMVKGAIKRKKDKEDIFSFWECHPERSECDGISFIPAGGKIKPEKSRDFNTYKGMRFEFNKKWDNKSAVEPLIRHIKHNWCEKDEQLFKYTIQWLAHCVQFPYEKKKVALVLQSKPGAGKALVMDKMREILGEMFCSPDIEDIMKYNGSIMGKLMVFFDETIWGGSKQKAGLLKKIISECELSYTEKYLPTFECENYASVIIASNGEWVVPADKNARRYFCLKLNDNFIGKSKKKDKWLSDCIDVEANDFYQWLMRVDLDDFDITWAPKTKELNKQIENGLSDYEKFIKEFLDAGEYPDGADITYKKSKADIYELFRKQHGNRSGQKGLTEAINKSIGEQINANMRIGGSRAIKVLDILKAREEFDKNVSPIEWSVNLEDGEGDSSDDYEEILYRQN
jgi:hypothetical protein